jgi:hypothetical protein
MDQPITVRPHPFRGDFDSIEAAVNHALSHPLRFDAKRDAERLLGTSLVDGWWTLSEWALQFSNGLWLRIWVPETEVRWCLTEEPAEPTGEAVLRVGSAPIRFGWPQGYVSEMDCSDLVAKRRGSVFRDLHVNHTGLYLYFQGHLVFEFHAIYRLDDGQNMLYVREDD